MLEPVDRLELMDQLSDIIFDRPYDDFFKGVEASMRVVSEAKTIDGKWVFVDKDDIFHESYKCSMCGQTIMIDVKRFSIEEMKFCPYCGAHMTINYADRCKAFTDKLEGSEWTIMLI